MSATSWIKIASIRHLWHDGSSSDIHLCILFRRDGGLIDFMQEFVFADIQRVGGWHRGSARGFAERLVFLTFIIILARKELSAFFSIEIVSIPQSIYVKTYRDTNVKQQLAEFPNFDASVRWQSDQLPTSTSAELYLSHRVLRNDQ